MVQLEAHFAVMPHLVLAQFGNPGDADAQFHMLKVSTVHAYDRCNS